MDPAASAPTAIKDPSPGSALLPLAVISNGGSTQNLTQGGWIEPLLAGEPNAHHLSLTSHDQVAGAVREAARLGAAAIVVNGGDGTADLVFGALLNDRPFAAPPPLALLSAGKTNMTAHAWCGPHPKEMALRHVLDSRRKGMLLENVIQRPILTLDRGDGAAPLRGAFFGAADVVNGILFCRKHIYPLNLPNAVSHSTAMGLLLWRSLFASPDSDDVTASWRPQGEQERGAFFFAGATTLDELILGLKIEPATNDGPLRYLSLRPGPRAIFAALPRLISKSVNAGVGRTVRAVQSLTLAFDGAYTLDGELYEAAASRPLALSAEDSLPFIRYDRTS
ncbi:MAG: diacylglycerol kinase family protein [Rhodospirillaceae bacterium]|nr:diacylglycerol kinase family protein [Rhodospirillaceae bacterium]